MYIKRVYNNNVVMVDDAGTERIAVGKGIAFGRKRGDVLDSASFEKVFTLDDPTQLSRLERLIKGIPSEYLLIAEDIVSMLRRESASVIDDNVLIALTDHISMALEREQAGINATTLFSSRSSASMGANLSLLSKHGRSFAVISASRSPRRRWASSPCT